MKRNLYTVFALLVLTGAASSYAATPDLKGAKGDNVTQPSTTPEASGYHLTGNSTITSNYIFRGISQTQNLPAFQTGVNLDTGYWGLYGSLWGSNVKFAESDSTLEVDTALGIKNTIYEDLNYDISYLHYHYPKSTGNYDELLTKLNYQFLTGLIGYSQNVYNTHKTGVYYNLSVNQDIPSNWIRVENVSVGAGIGYYSLPKSAGFKNYVDYSAQISKAFGNFSIALQWTDTNHQSVDDDSIKKSHIMLALSANY